MLIVNVERLNSAAHGGGELRSVLDIGAAKAIVPQLVKSITKYIAGPRFCRRFPPLSAAFESSASFDNYCAGELL